MLCTTRPRGLAFAALLLWGFGLSLSAQEAPEPSPAAADGAQAEQAQPEAAAPAETPALRLMVFPARSIDELAGGKDSNPALNSALTEIIERQASRTGFTLVPVGSTGEEASATPGEGATDAPPPADEAPAADAPAASASPDAADSPSDDQSDFVLGAGRKGKAHATLSIFWFAEGRRVTLIAKVYDVWQGRLVAGTTLNGLDDISLLNAADSLLSELLAELSAQAPDIIAEYGSGGPGTMSRELVILSPDEGALVTLVGGDVLGTIEKGRIVLPFRPLALNRRIEFRVEKAGYYPKQVELLIKDTKPEIKLPALYPLSSFGVALWLQGDDLKGFIDGLSGTPLPAAKKLGAGLGFRWFPTPDIWYLQASYQFSWLNQRGLGGLPVPELLLHQAGAEAAIAVLTPPEWPVRFFVGAGIGTYLSHNGRSDAPFFVDPYLDFPNLVLQANLHPLIIELSAGMRFVFDSGANLLPVGLLRNFNLSRISLGVQW